MVRLGHVLNRDGRRLGDPTCHGHLDEIIDDLLRDEGDNVGQLAAVELGMVAPKHEDRMLFRCSGRVRGELDHFAHVGLEKIEGLLDLINPRVARCVRRIKPKNVDTPMSSSSSTARVATARVVFFLGRYLHCNKIIKKKFFFYLNSLLKKKRRDWYHSNCCDETRGGVCTVAAGGDAADTAFVLPGGSPSLAAVAAAAHAVAAVARVGTGTDGGAETAAVGGAEPVAAVGAADGNAAVPAAGAADAFGVQTADSAAEIHSAAGAGAVGSMDVVAVA